MTPAVFATLRTRNARLYLAGQLVSQVGTWLTLTAQVLLLLRLTRSGAVVGLLPACQFAPVLLFGPWAGTVIDRVDKRRLLLVLAAAAMVQAFLLAALAFSAKPSVLVLFELAFVRGCVNAADGPAGRALLSELVPDGVVQNAVSLNSASNAASRIVGPLAAGALVAAFGIPWCFLLDGASFVAVLVTVWQLDRRRAPVAEHEHGRRVRDGLRYVRAVPELWVALVLLTVVGMLSYNTMVVLPLFATRSLGASASTYGLLLAGMGAGSVLGALSLARAPTMEVPHVARAAALLGLAMCLLAAAPGVAVALPLAAVQGLASMVYLTGSGALLQRRSDPAMRGRVLALQSAVLLGTTPIGGPILGWICDVFDPRAGLVVGGLAAVVAGRWASRQTIG